MKRISGHPRLSRAIRRVEEASAELLEHAERTNIPTQQIWCWRKDVLTKAREYTAAVRALARLAL